MTRIGIPESPYLTLEEARLYCRRENSSLKAFRQYLHRQNIPIRRFGNRVVVRKDVLESGDTLNR